MGHAHLSSQWQPRLFFSLDGTVNSMRRRIGSVSRRTHSPAALVIKALGAAVRLGLSEQPTITVHFQSLHSIRKVVLDAVSVEPTVRQRSA